MSSSSHNPCKVRHPCPQRCPSPNCHENCREFQEWLIENRAESEWLKKERKTSFLMEAKLRRGEY